MSARTAKISFSCLVVSLACLAWPAWACSVPVFRYALENWPADPYRVTVFHRGELSPQELVVAEFLQKQASGCDGNANLEVSTVDLAAPQEEAVQELWQAQRDPRLPWMVASCPGASGQPEAAWACPFTMENVRALLDSPSRREVARRLLSGESAVWVLLESGDVEKDAAAALLLDAELGRIERVLALPEEPAWPTDELFGAESGPPLRVAFSVVNVSRNDSAERAFVSMLTRTEPELDRYRSEPMAFPIFGRGRCLYALVGRGINAPNIERACGFLVGWCSCEVKWLNPGMDMLMSVDWEGMIAGPFLTDELLPPLTGLSDFAQAKEAPVQEGPASETAALAEPLEQTGTGEPEKVRDSGALLRNTLLALLLVCAGTGAGALILKWKRR